MLQCPKCNYDNELGRIFCHSCGTKLDLSQIKPPTEGAKMRRRVKNRVLTTVRLVVELLLIGVLLLGIALICLTPEVKPFQPSGADLNAAEAKRHALDKMVTNRKGGTVVITEAELNTFLNSMTYDKPTGNGIEVTPVAMRATLLKDGSIKMEFVGNIHFWSAFEKHIYVGYECTPVILDGQCQFLPNGGWLGKLPLHPRLLVGFPLVGDYFGRLFENLKDDKKHLLDSLTTITVSKDAVTCAKEGSR
jgi:hypothetical protein